MAFQKRKLNAKVNPIELLLKFKNETYICIRKKMDAVNIKNIGEDMGEGRFGQHKYLSTFKHLNYV